MSFEIDIDMPPSGVDEPISPHDVEVPPCDDGDETPCQHDVGECSVDVDMTPPPDFVDPESPAVVEEVLCPHHAEETPEEVEEPPPVPDVYLPLKKVFIKFCQMGVPGAKTMTGKNFYKICKDSGIIDNDKVTQTDVDMEFSKRVRKGRKMEYRDFEIALENLAELRGENVKVLRREIMRTSPSLTDVTSTLQDGIYEKLNDTSLYTGIFKESHLDCKKGKDYSSSSTYLPKLSIPQKVEIVFLYGKYRDYRAAADKFNKAHPDLPPQNYGDVVHIMTRLRDTGTVLDDQRCPGHLRSQNTV